MSSEYQNLSMLRETSLSLENDCKKPVLLRWGYYRILRGLQPGQSACWNAERLGRVLKSAEIHTNEGNMLKAVETLATSAVYNDYHAQPMIEYLLAGLWWGLTFGVLPTCIPIVLELLQFRDKFDRMVMTKQEANEASCFHLFIW